MGDFCHSTYAKKGVDETVFFALKRYIPKELEKLFGYKDRCDRHSFCVS